MKVFIDKLWRLSSKVPEGNSVPDVTVQSLDVDSIWVTWPSVIAR